jgi:hypothetical protein
MSEKVNPVFGKFDPEPSVNVFELKEGGYQFYGWGAESQKFDTVEELLERIERYFKDEEGKFEVMK